MARIASIIRETPFPRDWDPSRRRSETEPFSQKPSPMQEKVAFSKKMSDEVKD
jgi:hypothetical protein